MSHSHNLTDEQSVEIHFTPYKPLEGRILETVGPKFAEEYTSLFHVYSSTGGSGSSFVFTKARQITFNCIN